MVSSRVRIESLHPYCVRSHASLSSDQNPEELAYVLMSDKSQRVHCLPIVSCSFPVQFWGDIMEMWPRLLESFPTQKEV